MVICYGMFTKILSYKLSDKYEPDMDLNNDILMK